MIGIHESLELVETSLKKIGYNEQNIVRDYEFATEGNGNIGRADCVAFGDPYRHDLATSCIAMSWLPAQQNPITTLKRLAFLAAPVAVITTPEMAQIWSIKSDFGSIEKPEATLSYPELDDYFVSNRLELAPDSLIRAKRAEFQLSLFRVDPRLLDFAEDATRRALVQQVERAMQVGMKLSVDDKQLGIIGHLVVMLLAACILNDKKYVKPVGGYNALQLLKLARDSYPKFFSQQELQDIPEELASPILESMRSNFSFRSITNEMLGYLYENALVSKAIREEFKIYYTPHQLARELLRRLPIEEIPAEDRYVLDGTCGSGSLLLASYERLNRLLPNRLPPEERHSYLVEHLRGIDKDGFACDLARLSLFLFSLPTGDSWRIENNDFLRISQQPSSHSPRIIVGNPPFEETTSKGKRSQLAANIMLKYMEILAPGGLIGIVLPETFLENKSCEEARKRLLSEFDLLEIWQLPNKIIPLSTESTAIILARKIGKIRAKDERFPIRIQRVMKHPQDMDRFNETGQPTYSFITTKSQSAPDGNRILPSPFAPLWRKLQGLPRLKEVADVCNGLQPWPGGKSHFSVNAPTSQWLPWLTGSKWFEPYSIKWEKQGAQEKIKYALYPDAFRRPQTNMIHLYREPKVLASARRARGNPWRIYAAIDQNGLLPRESIHAVWTRKAGTTLEEITAVLNSFVANAWVDNTNISRSIEVNTIQFMPFPRFSSEMRDSLVNSVRKIMALLEQLDDESESIEELIKLTNVVDNIVFDAYGLTDGEIAMLKDYFQGFPRPGRLGCYEHKDRDNVPASLYLQPSQTWRVVGEVLRLDMEEGVVNVELRGFPKNESIDIPISARMPGWFLRPGVLFRAMVPPEDRQNQRICGDKLWNFEMLDFGYLSDQEIRARLNASKVS